MSRKNGKLKLMPSDAERFGFIIICIFLFISFLALLIDDTVWALALSFIVLIPTSIGVQIKKRIIWIIIEIVLVFVTVSSFICFIIVEQIATSLIMFISSIAYLFCLWMYSSEEVRLNYRIYL